MKKRLLESFDDPVWNYIILVVIVLLSAMVLMEDPSPQKPVQVDVYERSDNDAEFYKDSSYMSMETRDIDQKLRVFGIFRGELFTYKMRNSSSGEDFYRITHVLDPGNGVMEGVVVPSQQQDDLKVSVLVDQELREAIGEPVKYSYVSNGTKKGETVWDEEEDDIYRADFRREDLREVVEEGETMVFVGNTYLNQSMDSEKTFGIGFS